MHLRGILSLIATALAITLTPKTVAQTANKCFPSAEVNQLTQFFEQLNSVLPKDKEQVCLGDVSLEWFKVIETLIDLKNLTFSEAKPFSTQDDFSFKSIADDGWWEYFTTRAKRIELRGMSCRPGVIAFVNRFLLPEQVNLCEDFYKLDRISRMETMLHEVRHFDGFGHVMCTRGTDINTPGACDARLEEKGSYAVGMQAQISLGMNGVDFTPSEKALARASALFALHNKFNEVTDVKIKFSLYLENASGEVFEWDPQKVDELRLITKLAQPAKIFSASIETILYPLDTTLSAYRMSEDFSMPLNRLGMYAEAYNRKTPAERAIYKGLGYNGNGGYLTAESLTTNCDFVDNVKKTVEFPEPMKTFATLEEDGQATVDYLVAESGKLYLTICANKVLTIRPAAGTLDTNVKKTAIIEGQRFALNSEGKLFELAKNGENYILAQPVALSQGDAWIELATRSMPYLFDEVLSP